MEKLSPFYNVDIFGYVKFKFSWGFSWNRFFGASKIAPSWASYLESDLGWFWVILRRGGWFGCHKPSRILVVWSLGANGMFLQITFGESVCDFWKGFLKQKSLESGGFAILLNLNKKQKKRQKSLNLDMPNPESVVALGGKPAADPRRWTTPQGPTSSPRIVLKRRRFWLFRWRKKGGWHFGGNFWKLKSQNRRPNYSNQTGRLISKMSCRLRLVNYCSLPSYKWYIPLLELGRRSQLVLLMLQKSAVDWDVSQMKKSWDKLPTFS